VRTLRILLVEDDHDHVFLIRRALADLDDVAVAIEVAGDGQQAVERLARSRFEAGGRPQLILLDLKIPRMDGLEKLRHIRADEAARGCRWCADLLGAPGIRRRRAPRGELPVQADRRPPPARAPAARRPLGPGHGLTPNPPDPAAALPWDPVQAEDRSAAASRRGSRVRRWVRARSINRS
jgi:CheY-like chemotaxis protein